MLTFLTLMGLKTYILLKDLGLAQIGVLIMYMS